MITGLKIFLQSIGELRSNVLFRAWYKRALAKTAFFSILLLTITLGVGIFLIQHFVENPYLAGASLVLWAIALFYFSITLAQTLMNSSMALFLGESGLVNALGLRILPGKDLGPLKWKVLNSTLVSIGISILFWPLFIIPFLWPVGIMIFAWALGREAFFQGAALAVRCQAIDAPTPMERGNFGLYVGLGILPAFGNLIPIVGILCFPLLTAGVYVWFCRKAS